MPVVVTGLNDTNVLNVEESFLENNDGQIRFEGNFNRIDIGEKSKAKLINITVGDHSVIEIGRDCSLACIELYAKARSNIRIGDRSSFTWRSSILAHESFDISVGAGCLFASDTLITVSDMHPIFERETGRRLNSGKSVFIGDNVWLGLGASVMKGAVVGDGSVIATRSIVTGKVPKHSVVAGIPARVIKTDIEWRHDLSIDHISPSATSDHGNLSQGIFSKLRSLLNRIPLMSKL